MCAWASFVLLLNDTPQRGYRPGTWDATQVRCPAPGLKLLERNLASSGRSFGEHSGQLDRVKHGTSGGRDEGGACPGFLVRK